MARSAKESGCFPYSSSTVCYIYVDNNGNTEQMKLHRSLERENLKKCNEVKDGNATIYAVWPGKWHSDLFIIDDMVSFEKAIMNI